MGVTAIVLMVVVLVIMLGCGSRWHILALQL